MKIKVRKNKLGEYYGLFVARNGRTVWNTGDGYVTRSSMNNAICLLDPESIYECIDETDPENPCTWEY